MNTKTILLYIAFSCIALIGYGQTSKATDFTVTGDIEGLVSASGNVKGMQFTAGYIYLYGAVKNGKSLSDSAKINNGHFVFKGKTDEPIRATIIFKAENQPHPITLYFFLENSNIKIAGKFDPENQTFVKSINITGSATENEYTHLFEEANETSGRSKIMDEYAKVKEKNDTAAMTVLNEKMKECMTKYSAYFGQYNDTHPKSYVRLYLLSNYIPRDEQGLNKLEKELKSLDPSLQSSFTAKSIFNAIAEQRKRASIGPGVKTFDFTQPDVDGKPVKLSDYKGKYVLLDFWASWCGPCRGENPNVLKVYNIYHEKGLEILAVSMDANREAWLKAVKEDKLPWKQVSDLKGWKNEAGQKYMIQAIPDNFLIDPNGIIVARGLRGEALTKKLAEIYK